MKKAFLYSAIALGALSFSSCKGFLDENPKTQLSESTVYSTEEALEAQMEGCYFTFVNGEPWLSYRQENLECASGLVIYGNSSRSQTNWLDQNYLTKFSDSSYQQNNAWQKLYSGVNRCNRLIDNLPDSPVDDNYKLEIEAEAKLIRAILYTELVRRWGDVPLRTSSPKNLSDVNIPRTAFYKVYRQIIEDLDFAAANMRDKARQEAINPEKDRFYNYAAIAFKSSVYLTIGSLLSAPENDNFWDSSKDDALIAAGKDPRTPDFTPIGVSTAEDAFRKAMELADEVIENGPYSLASDYRQLFRWDKHEDFFLPEAICRLQISNEAANSINMVTWYAPPYPEGTLDVSNSSSNAVRARPSRFGVDNFISRTGGKLGTGSYSQYIFTTTPDPRYRESIRSSYMRLDDSTQVVTYPSESYINNTSNLNCLPFIWKYINPQYNANRGQCGFYLMRLAEMYLISAEAAAQLSSSVGDAYWNKAIERVNVLRDRAARSNDSGERDATVWEALEWKADKFETKEELALGVWWERYIEMAFEGHEYLDTHRYGATWLSENIAKPANNFYMNNPANKLKFTPAFFKKSIDDGYVFPENPQDLRKSLLEAFPRDEITNNPAISFEDQNDFYWQ